MAVIDSLNEIAAGTCRPDLTVLIDCPVETGLARALARIGAVSGSTPREERFEKEPEEFHAKVRAGYLSLAKAHPERFILIDGSTGIDKVAEEIFRTVAGRISL
jgi:dTMP kinase